MRVVAHLEGSDVTRTGPRESLLGSAKFADQTRRAMVSVSTGDTRLRGAGKGPACGTVTRPSGSKKGRWSNEETSNPETGYFSTGEWRMVGLSVWPEVAERSSRQGVWPTPLR